MNGARQQRLVAHFMPWTGIGGTEHATLRIAEAVRDRGFRSVAFCLRDAEAVHAFFQAAGIETVPYDAPGLSLRRPLTYYRNSRVLAREFRRLQVDILHCADVEAGVHGAFAGRMGGVPVLCHVRNPWPVASTRQRVLLAAVNEFVFVSRDTWAQFAFRVAPARGRVLYDGVSTDAAHDPAVGADVRRELALDVNAPVVGMVARVAPQKDYITLGRAAARVLAVMPNVRFLVVGDHSANATHREHHALVREKLQRAGVLDAFVFTGFRSDVSRVMHAFDVFVLSTHFEGLPLVILEAMAMGLPVVATAVNGIPEVISREEIGMLVPHDDDAILARQLLLLLSDAALRARMGAAGRAAMQQEFSPEAFARNVLALYSETLGARDTTKYRTVPE